jgi:hypothetical protein
MLRPDPAAFAYEVKKLPLTTILTCEAGLKSWDMDKIIDVPLIPPLEA